MGTYSRAFQLELFDAVAALDGRGDPDDSASFTCRVR
jgi:hypothetical protein